MKFIQVTSALGTVYTINAEAIQYFLDLSNQAGTRIVFGAQSEIVVAEDSEAIISKLLLFDNTDSVRSNNMAGE